MKHTATVTFDVHIRQLLLSLCFTVLKYFRGRWFYFQMIADYLLITKYGNNFVSANCQLQFSFFCSSFVFYLFSSYESVFSHSFVSAFAQIHKSQCIKNVRIVYRLNAHLHADQKLLHFIHTLERWLAHSTISFKSHACMMSHNLFTHPIKTNQQSFSYFSYTNKRIYYDTQIIWNSKLIGSCK